MLFILFVVMMLSGNVTAGSFLDEELSSDPVGGGALVNRVKREDAAAASAQSLTDTLGLTNEEGDTTLIQGIKDSFFSGGNFAYGIYADVRRMYDNSPDPSFSPEIFLKDNAYKFQITTDYYPAFARTSSKGEAMDLVHDIRERQDMRRRIKKMDAASQLFSHSAALIPDLFALLIGTAICMKLFRTRSWKVA